MGFWEKIQKIIKKIVNKWPRSLLRGTRVIPLPQGSRPLVMEPSMSRAKQTICVLRSLRFRKPPKSVRYAIGTWTASVADNRLTPVPRKRSKTEREGCDLLTNVRQGKLVQASWTIQSGQSLTSGPEGIVLLMYCTDIPVRRQSLYPPKVVLSWTK